jgi:hypothetical protein
MLKNQKQNVTKSDKITNNDLQNSSQKNNDTETRTPLKTTGKLRCPGRVSSSCSTSDIRHVPVTNPSIFLL